MYPSVPAEVLTYCHSEAVEPSGLGRTVTISLARQETSVSVPPIQSHSTVARLGPATIAEGSGLMGAEGLRERTGMGSPGHGHAAVEVVAAVVVEAVGAVMRGRAEAGEEDSDCLLRERMLVESRRAMFCLFFSFLFSDGASVAGVRDMGAGRFSELAEGARWRTWWWWEMEDEEGLDVSEEAEEDGAMAGGGLDENDDEEEMEEGLEVMV